MAVGTYDANGIWHYGESDNIAPFSTTLNKLSDSASSAITADRARIATLEAGSLSGLIPVIPQSVNVASGTAAVNTLGVVSFSNASAITINNVFTSFYKNYRLLVNIDSASGVLAIGQQLTSGGTASAGGLYFWAGNWQTINGNGPGLLAASNQNYWYMIEATNGGVTWVNHSQDIFNPAVAKDTSMTGSGVTISGNWRHVTYSSMHQNPSSFDGMKFTSSTSATFSGTIQVLAYND